MLAKDRRKKNRCLGHLPTYKAIGGGDSVSMETKDSDEASIENLNVCNSKGEVNGTAPWLGYGDLYYPSDKCSGTFHGTPGIELIASGATGGKYYFVQLINSDSRSYTSTTGGVILCGPTSGLDGNYPYRGIESPTTASDGPQIPLIDNYVLASRSFNATMYLLWQPDKLSGATADPIPVPIGYQIWHVGTTADGVQGRKEWKWKNPKISPDDDHGKVGDFKHSTDTDPNTWDGYPQWDGIASTSCGVSQAVDAYAFYKYSLWNKIPNYDYDFNREGK